MTTNKQIIKDSSLEWTPVLTSAQGAATLSVRGGAVEYFASSSSPSIKVLGHLLQEDTQGNAAVQNAQSNLLRFDYALQAGKTLYMRPLAINIIVTVVISLDTE